MALSDVIHSAVGVVAGIVTRGKLVVTVQHSPRTGTDSQGRPVYGAAVNRRAVYEDIDREIRRDTGQVIERRSRLTFFEDFPIAYEDRIVVQGKTAPIGRIDKGVAVDGRAAVVQIWLGQG